MRRARRAVLAGCMAAVAVAAMMVGAVRPAAAADAWWLNATGSGADRMCITRIGRYDVPTVACDSLDHRQHWKIVWREGYMTFVSRLGNECLTVQRFESGYPVFTIPCASNDQYQQFREVSHPTGPGAYLQTRIWAWCLSASRSHPVHVHPCDGSTLQGWRPLNAGTG